MELTTFFVTALIAVASAIGLVVRRNPLHGALFLVVNLFCVAVLYLLLQAEFLAAAQVIIYAGAIMVLFLFAIMILIPGRAETGRDPFRRQRLAALPLGAAFLLLVGVLMWGGPPPGGAPPPPGGAAAVGRLLFTDYLLPFEITAVLLLAALVGALVLARRRA